MRRSRIRRIHGCDAPQRAKVYHARAQAGTPALAAALIATRFPLVANPAATPLTAPVAGDPARWAAMAERTMIGRNGELDDLRGVTVFLASRASDYITGQTIFVDGGFSSG